MAARHRQAIRTILNFMRDYGCKSLLTHLAQYCTRQGRRRQAKLVAEIMNHEIGNFLTEVRDEERKVKQYTKLVENSNVRDKLVCAVFNDLFKQAQEVVMGGAQTQLRYFINRYGATKTLQMVKSW